MLILKSGEKVEKWLPKKCYNPTSFMMMSKNGKPANFPHFFDKTLLHLDQQSIKQRKILFLYPDFTVNKSFISPFF